MGMMYHLIGTCCFMVTEPLPHQICLWHAVSGCNFDERASTTVFWCVRTQPWSGTSSSRPTLEQRDGDQSTQARAPAHHGWKKGERGRSRKRGRANGRWLLAADLKAWKVLVVLDPYIRKHGSPEPFDCHEEVRHQSKGSMQGTQCRWVPRGTCWNRNGPSKTI